MLKEELRKRLRPYIDSFTRKGELYLQGGNLFLYLLFLALLCEEKDRKFLIVIPETHAVEEEEFDFIKEITGKEILYFPPLAPSLYPKFPPSLTVNAVRTKVLYRVAAELADLVVAPWNSLVKLPLREKFRSQVLLLQQGEEVDMEFVEAFLEELGYSKAELVEEPGQYSVRGGIVDFFSPWEDNPCRIEFDEDFISSIRTFDPHTQRSIKKVNEAKIVPLREYPLRDGVKSFEEEAKKRWPGKDFSYHLERLISQVLEGEEPPEWHYLVRTGKEWGSPFEYFEKYEVVHLDPAIMKREREEKVSLWKEEHQQRSNQFYLSLPPEELLPTGPEAKIKFFEKELEVRADKVSFSPLPSFTGKLSTWIENLERERARGRKCYIVIKEKTRAERLLSAFSDKIYPSSVLQGSLKRGFLLEDLLVYGEENLFPPSPFIKPEKRRVEVFKTDFRDIKVGSPIVHSDYGVGIFKGLVRLKQEGIEGEFMLIEYADGEKLYLPVERFDKIYPFTVMEGQPVRVDRLSGIRWRRLKSRVRRSMEKLVESLLQLYAERKAKQGFAFKSGDEWLSQFEAEFPFEETPDQSRTWEEVKRDMGSPWPMDRLIVGDVGFGKTEIAMRAAFKAVVNGKQVAVLCPTTVLALQHLRTFRERFANFPVIIEGLTRLTPASKQQEILEKLREGRIDIIIGTHRLLSDDVGFKDLGLLIIDEEQRFGVRHKEKIKEMKRTVDCLTMTATPIPRTLSLALFNIWDMSVIQTPPKGRLAIETFVLPYSEEVFAQALHTELARGGQVYVVCNNIEQLNSLAENVKKLHPASKPVVLHGKMKSSEVERRMLDFIAGKYNVLVTTTIIENGVDIPNVNTLVVIDAHRFGLAQLYQLRGRVGRFTRQAYAYLFYNEEETLSDMARERLKAIKEFSQLGSGFRLAAVDMQLRGAGTLLGRQQHGHMEELGFDYYMKLLEETIAEMKGEGVRDVELSLGFDFSIPSFYIPQVDERINFYRRIISCRSLQELKEVLEEMQDKYGKAPEAIEPLISLGKIKILARQMGIKKIERKGAFLEVAFYSESPPDPVKLMEFLKKKKGRFTEGGFLIEVKPSARAIENILQELYNFLK